MPLINIIVLTGIVSAFVAFGLALAWGDRQTRHLPRAHAGTEPQAPGTQDDVKLAA